MSQPNGIQQSNQPGLALGDYEDLTPGPVSPSPPGSPVLVNQLQTGTITAPTPKTLLSFQPVDPAKGPFQWVIGGAAFNSVWDNVGYFGWNVNSGGGKIIPGDSQWFIALEHSYLANPGGHLLEEGYFQWVSADGTTTIRPIFFHIDATAKTDTIEFQATAVAFTDPTSHTVEWGSWGEAGLTLGDPLNPPAGAQTLALVPGAGSQSSIQLYQNASNATPALAINTVSNTEIQARVNGHATLFFFDTRMSIGIEDNSGALTIQDQGGSTALQTLDGPAGQALDHYRAVSASKATVYTRITGQGYLATAKNALPDDNRVSNGEVFFWLDATPGATKMMFKAKDSGGTVRTGSVALT